MPQENNNRNREIKNLERICYLILILTAIIGPWFLHDRKITALEIKVEAMTKTVDELKTAISTHNRILSGKEFFYNSRDDGG
jgi:hypothetical protein